MEPVRLHKLLAGWGVASRRAVEAMILAGRIRVDGEVFTDPGRRVDPATCRVEVDGRPVGPHRTATTVVMVFHKPAGVLSSLGDRFGRPTLADYFPGPERLYPIGRLDSDSTGLLLMTNAGELTNRLLHPRYKVEKEYLVHVAGPPLTPAERDRFERGLELDDGRTAPCRLRPGEPVFPRKPTRQDQPWESWAPSPRHGFGFSTPRALPGGRKPPGRPDGKASRPASKTAPERPSLPPIAPAAPALQVWRVTLREGRKRQIKRMFAALGRRVTALHRLRFGPIRLGTLPPGKARLLSERERRALWAAAGLEER